MDRNVSRFLNAATTCGRSGESELASQSPPPFAAHTILVVDDSENDAALLKLMFRRSRILNPVQVVNRIQEGIEYLNGDGRFSDRQSFPFPTLLLLDVHLPDGSGFDLLRWLQTNKGQKPLAVVVLTGSDVTVFKMAYQMGAHSFLTKPLKFEDFHNMVQHVRGIKLTRNGAGHVLEVE
ncbi:MAG TPA: response regulator [Verrucomicrobiae bacterium]|nr:response regulator [Verrucomicrobiae bacterium]